jgi:Cdc6-like AAA superfamily ATPase
MEQIDTRKGLEAAVAKLKRLLEDKERIEVEIARQQRKVVAWAEICDDSAYADPFDLGLTGLSDACRSALRGSRVEWMTTADIVTALREVGFSLDKYKAPMASIITTVNRMVEAGEVLSRTGENGVTEYKWVSKIPNFEEQLARYAVETVKAGQIARQATVAIFGRPKK